MMLGISTWTYGWSVGIAAYPPPERPMSALDLLARARAHAIQVVQIADNLPLDRLGQSELEAIRSQARDWKISLEVGTRGIEPDRLLRYLEIARFLDAPFVRTLTHSAASQPTLVQAEEWLRQVLPAYEKAGVSIALENNERFKASQFAALIAALDSPSLGICLDTVNSLGGLETARDVLPVLAPYVLNLHVKDFRIQRVPSKMGFHVDGAPAGEGQLDIPWVLAELAWYGKRPNRILELWTPYQGSVAASIRLEEEWAERSIKYLQNL